MKLDKVLIFALVFLPCTWYIYKQASGNASNRRAAEQPRSRHSILVRHPILSPHMTQSESPIARFARHVLGKPIYPYQCELAEAIHDSIEGGHRRIISVMIPRKSGNTQTSPVLEAYLLMTGTHVAIANAAPTLPPQVVNSRLHLLSLLDTPPTR